VLLVALDAFSRLVGAIVCAALALSIWDIGSRSVSRLVRDVAAGVRRRSSLLRGAIRTMAGALFAALALELLIQALPYSQLRFFSVFAIGAFVTALIVENLLGTSLRRLIGIGGAPLPGVEDRGPSR
jgi:hypothetical protein